MYINHLILENFAAIKVGMKTTRIEIDFSTRKNKIMVLRGPNGCSKTSLLSTLTPFATLGNLDIRDGQGLIIAGKNGYKEIEIIDGPNDYVIKHFYSPSKESHTVKSYIEKNGEELNVNGNVTSFKAIVEEELGLEINFLKLIRLGNNVTNLLELTATERKNFLSDLLQDLDVYLKIFKKLTDDARLLKTQISHISDKMKRTGIDDIKESEKSKSSLEEELSDLEEKNKLEIATQGGIQETLNSIDYMSIQNQYREITKKLNKAKSALLKHGNSLSLETVKSNYDSEMASIATLEKEITVKETRAKSELESVDSIRSELKTLEIEISKEENNESILSAREIFYRLRREVNELDSSFENYHPLYTYDELNHLLSEVIKIQNILDTAYEFGKGPMKKVLELMEQNYSVNNYINNGLLDYDKSNLDSSSLLSKLMDGMNGIEPSCDHNTCGLYQLWVQIKNLQHQEEVRRNNQDPEEFYKYMDVVNQRVVKTIETLKGLKEYIEKLPKEYQVDFRLDRIFEHMKHLEPIIDRAKFNVLLTEITEYNNYLAKKKELDAAEITYNLLDNSTNLGYLKKRHEELVEKRDTRIESYKDLIDSLEDDREALSNHKESVDDMDSLIEALTHMKEMEDESNSLQETITKYNDLSEKFVEVTRTIKANEFMIQKYRKDLMTISVAISEYQNLTSDMEKFSKRYDENSYIRRAMSAKEGIPLEYINIYMSNIKSSINELLDIVYDGDLQIDDFKINATEFRIPYIKEGYLVPDISQASQGETAFLSIALSFALISESILKYNIVLLDEIDGNLDDSNRKKFIKILERLMDMINSEQVFLISHNNLFSMYPVDVLSLNGEIDTSMQLAHYIPIKKG